jgi:hypothetical protein
MSFHYADETRADDPHYLPSIQTWEADVLQLDCPRCGALEVPRTDSDTATDGFCLGCSETVPAVLTGSRGWFFWYCFPGCMADSEPCGPYDTEALALEAAREGAAGE